MLASAVHPRIEMKRILVWAVDAFEPPGDLLNSAVRALQSMAPRLEAEVEPVYLLTPSQINLATEFSELAAAPSARSYRPAAEKALGELIRGFAIPRILPPRVLVVDSTSTHMAVDALSRYAEGIEAEAIVVSSHGRSGLGRFLLGSFAETLMLYSKRPVIIVHPGGKPSSDLNRLLVPTDLTEAAKPFWDQSLRLAQSLGMEVLLFHCVPYPVEPVIQSGVYLLGGGWLPIHAYMTEEIQRRQKRVDEWISEGQAMGLKVNGSIYAEGGGISDSILRNAVEHRVSLISMAVQSGPITSAIIGSVTREVVRRAPCPVWILRPDGKRQKKSESAA